MVTRTKRLMRWMLAVLAGVLPGATPLLPTDWIQRLNTGRVQMHLVHLDRLQFCVEPLPPPVKCPTGNYPLGKDIFLGMFEIQVYPVWPSASPQRGTGRRG